MHQIRKKLKKKLIEYCSWNPLKNRFLFYFILFFSSIYLNKENPHFP